MRQVQVREGWVREVRVREERVRERQVREGRVGSNDTFLPEFPGRDFNLPFLLASGARLPH